MSAAGTADYDQVFDFESWPEIAWKIPNSRMPHDLRKPPRGAKLEDAIAATIVWLINKDQTEVRIVFNGKELLINKADKVRRLVMTYRGMGSLLPDTQTF